MSARRERGTMNLARDLNFSQHITVAVFVVGVTGHATATQPPTSLASPACRVTDWLTSGLPNRIEQLDLIIISGRRTVDPAAACAHASPSTHHHDHRCCDKY
jgi:hypothetical protein